MLFFLLSEPAYFILTFSGGEKFDFQSKQVIPLTEIIFRCNENATWDDSKDGKVPQLAHVRVNYTIELLPVIKVGKINNLSNLR